MVTSVSAQIDERLLSISDVRDRLGGTSRSYVYELFYSGMLPSVKVGARRLVRISDLNAFIASLEPEAMGEQ